MNHALGSTLIKAVTFLSIKIFPVMEIDEGIHANIDDMFESALSEVRESRPWRGLDQIEKDEADGTLSYHFVTNDGTDASLIDLVQCKCLFGRQLPKMPKEYIVRLVFDRRHFCLMMKKKESVGVTPIDSSVSSPSESNRSKPASLEDVPVTGKTRDALVAAVCFRPFGKFCEIAFLAVSSKDQVKGYGTRLMNQMKQALKNYGVTDLVTYADNAAVGYFAKQGFYSPRPAVFLKPDSDWHTCVKSGYESYIKDYDGANKMVCCIYKDVNYLTLGTMREEVKSAIWKATIQILNPTRYSGLKAFPSKVYEIPGLEFMAPRSASSSVNTKKAGAGDERQRPVSSRLQVPTSVESMVHDVLETALSNGASWPFREPVDVSLAPDYYQVILNPIDICSMKAKNARKEYASLSELRKDFDLMFENCVFYNGEDSVYSTAAEVLKKLVVQRIERLQQMHHH